MLISCCIVDYLVLLLQNQSGTSCFANPPILLQLHSLLLLSMAESLTRAINPCPFCNIYFKSVGNHLRHCKYRNGRDYSQYLAPKTLAKRSQKRKKMLWPKCKKLFVRLGTQLVPTLKTVLPVNLSPPHLGVSSAVSAMLTPPAAASI